MNPVVFATAFLAVLSLVALWMVVSGPRRRSLEMIRPLQQADDKAPFHLSAHCPLTGRNLSMPILAEPWIVGVLQRLVRERRMLITTVEPFDRTEPRHVQSLLGALRVLDLEIAERGSDRLDTVADGTADDLLRLADHVRLDQLATQLQLNNPFTTAGDAGRTLAMQMKALPDLTPVYAS